MAALGSLWLSEMCISVQPELVSDSPVMVADSKFAETTKFLQNVLVSTKWCLLIRTCFSGKLPTAFLSGRKWGKKKEEKPTNALVYNKMFPAKEKKKKKSNICSFNSGDLEQRGTR